MRGPVCKLSSTIFQITECVNQSTTQQETKNPQKCSYKYKNSNGIKNEQPIDHQ